MILHTRAKFCKMMVMKGQPRVDDKRQTRANMWRGRKKKRIN